MTQSRRYTYKRRRRGNPAGGFKHKIGPDQLDLVKRQHDAGISKRTLADMYGCRVDTITSALIRADTVGVKLSDFILPKEASHD